MSDLKYLPCPDWCNEPHETVGVLAQEEQDKKKRFHAGEIATIGHTGVGVERIDDLTTGTAGQLHLYVLSDDDLTAKEAVQVAHLLQLGSLVVTGQMTMQEARRAAATLAVEPGGQGRWRRWFAALLPRRAVART